MAGPLQCPGTMSVHHHEILIIGAGFAGLGMAIRLRQAGIDDFAILERADAAGGTWRDNRYPGCACDVPSHLYSYSFAPNPQWQRAYAPQPEIRAYLEHCVARYALGPQLHLRAEVVEARWDETTARWEVATRDGRRFCAPVLVAGLGGLSNPAIPELPGRERFAGPSFHTAQWPDGIALDGRRVAVIGTGASAIQLIPQLAPRVAQLTVYQRTPAWVLPKPDRPLRDWERRLFERLPFTQRLMRSAIYWQHEGRALAFVVRPRLMKLVAREAGRHLARQVADPALRARLTPDYTIGCKRILIADDYYPALQRPNVELVDGAVHELTPHGVVAADGRERPADAVVWCTGFKAQEPVRPGLFVGRRGQDLWSAWQRAPEAYLGCTVAGFPNLFMLVGPNTGLGHNSMIYMIESQLAYVMSAVQALRRGGLRSVEVRPEAQQAYNAELQRRLAGTVWASGCRSWYLDAQGRNTTLWPGFTFEFRRRTRRFDTAAYRVETR